MQLNNDKYSINLLLMGFLLGNDVNASGSFRYVLENKCIVTL